jgi:CRP-like cAMP-binding protein/Fe-S-cluster-containing hydrogenase component 2
MSLDRLREYPFLALLPETILRKLQPNLSEETYEPGASILRMGDYSDAAYYVRQGAVDVRLKSSDERVVASAASAEAVGMLGDMASAPDATSRVTLGQGEIFGEMGALSRYPISADVTASVPTTCLVIRTPALRLMLKQQALADFRAFVDDRYRTRTLASHLRRTDIFKTLADDAVERLRQRAELLAFDPGEVIVEQASPGDALYLVRGGYVKVSVRGAAEIAVTYLRKGDWAGELGILTDQPWPVTLTALEHVELVRIARVDVLDVIRAYPEIEGQLRDLGARRAHERRLALERPAETRYLQTAMDTGLINGESVLLIDLETCTRCDDCVAACADAHDGTPRFVREGSRHGRWSIPAACYQCTDPVCMIGCPTGAITRPHGSFKVTIDRDTCIGCHNCVRRCPWGNIIEVPYQSPRVGRSIDLATKCDLCAGRRGGPACVEACPHGSAVRISFKDLRQVVSTLSR